MNFFKNPLPYIPGRSNKLLSMIIYKRITYLYGFYKIKTKSPKTWSQDKQEENITVQINFLLGFLVSSILH